MILIVDDDSEALEPLKLALKNLGQETAVAPNGKEALAAMITNQFELIFLDIGLPDKTGLEVLDEIEALRLLALQDHIPWKNIPIITYSAYGLYEFGLPEERGYHLIDHWQKPLTYEQLSKYSREMLAKLGLLERTG